MRFHYGPIPEEASFAPEAEGWFSIREPRPGLLQLVALPVHLGVLVFRGALLYLVFPRELFTKPGVVAIPPLPLLAILVLLALLHECLHVLAMPDWGASANSVIGLWLSRVLLYAHYEGPMSRNRLLLVLAVPFVALSLLPSGLIALLRCVSWTPAVMSAVALLSILSMLAGLGASGDLLGFGLAVFQIPSTAVVRNKGWRTYWKLREQ